MKFQLSKIEFDYDPNSYNYEVVCRDQKLSFWDTLNPFKGKRRSYYIKRELKQLGADNSLITEVLCRDDIFQRTGITEERIFFSQVDGPHEVIFWDGPEDPINLLKEYESLHEGPGLASGVTLWYNY